MVKKTSMKDIAQDVGVSIALVSYVLNNQKENRISKEVAIKIREAARRLNYQPNQIAKSLKTNKTYTLGLIVADISNPFSSSLARIIENEADKFNYTVLFGSSDENPQRLQKLIDTLLNRQVDGLIIAAPEGSEAQLTALQQRIPFVLIDRYFPNLSTNYVALDNYKSIYTGVQHLVDSGYRRIGLISFATDLFHVSERKRGYRAALKDNQITISKAWINELGQATYTGEMAKSIQELLSGKQPVNAILFASNALALHGLKQLNALGVSVPDDVAVLSFDEAEAYDLFHTPVTCIRQPLADMGQMATRLLIDIIQKNNRTTQVNLDAELIIRASTRPVQTLATAD
ncbi:LacI family DNA-binding transcriptional regulator [Fibrella forsythiae]|uniref:Substrate-binding domain-containing protein n=1 Tax=Fibrella forsythiae TaxID=2817061 RepID=A0ABS3JIA0_9BACT|nr:substrate-binding domain-containing protein [Fibrella forsythiae]MBO0949141.1 substrate-binding domain-containing protein [Fibrella forsythiae]